MSLCPSLGHGNSVDWVGLIIGAYWAFLINKDCSDQPLLSSPCSERGGVGSSTITLNVPCNMIGGDDAISGAVKRVK